MDKNIFSFAQKVFLKMVGPCDTLKKSLHFSTFLGYATHTVSIFENSIKIKKVENICIGGIFQFVDIYQIKTKDIISVHIHNSKRNRGVLFLIWLAVLLSIIDLLILFYSLFYTWEENIKNIFGIVFGMLVVFFIPFLIKAYFLLRDDSFRNTRYLEFYTVHPKENFSAILSSADAKTVMEAIREY